MSLSMMPKPQRPQLTQLVQLRDKLKQQDMIAYLQNNGTMLQVTQPDTVREDQSEQQRLSEFKKDITAAIRAGDYEVEMTYSAHVPTSGGMCVAHIEMT